MREAALRGLASKVTLAKVEVTHGTAVSPKAEERRFSHYFRDVGGLEAVDVYRVLQLFGVTDPCLQHAIKKLLVAGGRGAKPATVDIVEAIASLQRCLEMQREDVARGTTGRRS